MVGVAENSDYISPDDYLEGESVSFMSLDFTFSVDDIYESVEFCRADVNVPGTQ